MSRPSFEPIEPPYVACLFALALGLLVGAYNLGSRLRVVEARLTAIEAAAQIAPVKGAP